MPTARLKLPYLAAAQAQKHVTYNDAMDRIDGLVHLTLKNHQEGAPPDSPAESDAFLVSEHPEGAWQGQSGRIAIASEGGWTFHQPMPGWRAFFQQDKALKVFDNGTWTPIRSEPSANPIAYLGISASANEIERLTIRTQVAWFSFDPSHPTNGSVQIKLNRKDPNASASLMFQNAWSARGEFGLLGSEGFGLKYSNDGTRFRTVLKLDPHTGSPHFPHGVGELGIGALGPIRNVIVNGGFELWQRGRTRTLSTGRSFTADRWSIKNTGPAGSSVLSSRLALPAGSPEGPPNCAYAMRISPSTPSAPGSIRQRIEGGATLAGQIASLGIWVRSNRSLTLRSTLIRKSDASSANPTQLAQSSEIVNAGGWKWVTHAMSIPACPEIPQGSNGFLELELTFRSVSESEEPLTIDLTGIQLESGRIARDFEPSNPALTRLLAYRYFVASHEFSPSSSMGITAIFSPGGAPGELYSSMVSFPVPMRKVPAVTLSNPGSSSGASTGIPSVDGSSRISATAAAVSELGFSMSASGNSARVGHLQYHADAEL